MNPPELVQLARSLDLDNDDQFTLRLEFGLACIERVEHLLTDDSVRRTFAIGKAFTSGKCTDGELRDAAVKASELARRHPGSGSMDGTGSAAVSTSHGVAAALAGRALEAAGYAAYASVYSYASHAVADLSAYTTEHDWQIRKLKMLAKDLKKDTTTTVRTGRGSTI